MKNHHAAVRFSFYTAVFSFLAAVTIFSLYFFSGDLLYAMIGYISIAVLGALNVIALVILIMAMNKNPAIKRIGKTTIAFQLFNIPVAIVCLWAAGRLTNIARITLVNETGTKLEQIAVKGCENQLIEVMEPGDEKTVWIDITSDCSVHMEYLRGDSTVKEEVCGYLCHGMGVVYTHKIGGANSQSDMW